MIKKTAVIVLFGIAVILGLLLASIAGGLFLFHTEFARERLQQVVDGQIPGSISWERQSLSLFAGVLEVTDLVLKDPDGKDVIVIPDLYLDIAWPVWPIRTLVVDSIRIDRPIVTLAEDSAGRLNIVKSLTGESDAPRESEAPSDDGFAANVKLGEAVIHAGTFQYRAGPGYRILLPDVHLDFQQGDLSKQRVRVRVKLTGGDVEWDGVKIPVESVHGSATLENRDLVSVSVALATRNKCHAELTGAIGEVFGAFLPDVRMTLQGDMDALLPMFSMPKQAEGRLSATVSLHNTLESPEGRLSILWTRGRAGGFDFKQAELVCRLQQGTVTVEKGELATPFGDVSLQGALQVHDAFPRGLLSDAIEPDAIAYQINGSYETDQTRGYRLFADGTAGSLDASFAIQGKGFASEARAGRFSVNAKINSFQHPEGLSLENVLFEMDSTFQRNGLTVEKAAVTADQSFIRGKGRYDLSTGRIQAVLSARVQLPMNGLAFPPLDEISGTAEVSAALNGPFENLKVEGEIVGTDIEYQDACIGNVFADSSFSGKRLRLKSVLVQNGRSRVHLSGQLSNLLAREDTGKPSLELSIHSDEIHSDDFYPQVTGVFKLEGSMAGKWDHPKGSLSVSGRDIEAYGRKIKALHLKAAGDRRRLYLEQPVVTFPNQDAVRLDGWVSYDENRFSVEVRSEGVALNQIDTWSRHDWNRAKLFFSFNGDGDFDNPRVEGSIGIRSLRLNGERLEPLVASVRLSDWILSVQDEQGQVLQATTNVKSGDMDARIKMDQIRLAPWFARGGMEDLAGDMKADISVAGNWRSRETIRLSSEFSDLKIFWKENPFVRAKSLKVDLADGRIEVPETRLTFYRDGMLKVDGEADLDGLVNMKIAGNIPADVLELFSDQVAEVKGLLGVEVSVGGSWKRPLILSSIEFQDVQARLPYLSDPLEGVTGVLTLSPEREVQTSLKGRCGKGQVTLKGGIGLQDYPEMQFDLALTGHAISVLKQDLEVLLTLDLTLQSHAVRSLLSGEVVILEGVYTRDVDLNPITMVAGRTRGEDFVPEPPEPSSVTGRIEVDIDVRYRNPFIVDNNIAILRLQPDFNIRGKMNRPVITGRAAVDSGTIMYQKREFEVQKGVVDFLNPYKMEPRFDILGRSRIRDWQIDISVIGVPDNLKIVLQSEPSLPDSDILSLIVFGKTVSEFIESEGGQSSSPADYIAGYMAEQIRENVKDSTGLDSVKMEYQSNGSDAGSAQARVELGKELSREVTVKYGIETIDSRVVQRAVTEYRILENVMLEAYQDSEGDYGGELQYRLEFR